MKATGTGKGREEPGDATTTAPAWGAKCFDACYAKGELDKQRDAKRSRGARTRTRIITVASSSSSCLPSTPPCIPPSRAREWGNGRPTDWLRPCHYERIDVLTLRRHSVFLTCCPGPAARAPTGTSLVAVPGCRCRRGVFRRIADRTIGKFLMMTHERQGRKSSRRKSFFW